MLTFEFFSVGALQKVLPFLQRNTSLCSDLSAGYLFMWQKGTDVRFCVRNDTLIVRQNIGEQPAFSYPIGRDVDGMIDELIAYVAANRLPLRFFAVDEEILEKIRGDERLQPATWAFNRRWSDYVYDCQEAATFAGKKYGGQRNHVNKFKKLYGEPDIRFLTADDREKVWALLDEYEQKHAVGGMLEKLELERTRELLAVCPALGLSAAGLFVAGELAAFSIGEVIGDTLFIHVEKALTRYEGVYPTIYSGFVRLVCAREGRTLRFVNREDDSGDPGLRTSKLQYHPVCLAHKYLVHVGSPAVKMADTYSFSSGGVVLTEIRESDKPAYLQLNTDVENNRWWGYDYRQDPNVSLPVDENTFYDLLRYDQHAGDSINFAVRLSRDGAMIGEAILWNFTYDGTAELGCRLLPAYQGKGYGTAAFGAAAFAARSLNVRARARCYRQNAVSRRMIEANGFVPCGEDDAFFYFTQDGKAP